MAFDRWGSIPYTRTMTTEQEIIDEVSAHVNVFIAGLMAQKAILSQELFEKLVIEEIGVRASNLGAEATLIASMQIRFRQTLKVEWK